ncbi:MAG: hypothetical protein ABF515_02045 [Bifidobacterium sp.]|uniref:DUF4190 domain-containing protein n=2 Tax=Bifidobacterium TaxID=1678 RepID=A0AB39URE4_9BIFI
MAVTSLVLGIIGLILSWIPIVNNFAAILAVISLIFGIIAIIKTGTKGKKKGRGLAIAGSALSIVALIITFSIQQSASKALDSIGSGSTTSQSSKSDSNAAASAKVELEATATGTGTATWGEAGSTSQNNFDKNWNKTITGSDAQKGYILTVMGDLTGTDSQKVSCTVLVNGQQKSHKEATGTAGTVTCDTSGLFN